jgi:hypothetical protein
MSNVAATLIDFILPPLVMFASPQRGFAKLCYNKPRLTGIVEKGSITMHRRSEYINEQCLIAKPATLNFAAAPESFVSILVLTIRVTHLGADRSGCNYNCSSIGMSLALHAAWQK